MTELFGIAAVQIQTVPWDLDSTLKRMEQHLQLIRDIYPWVNLACFPELCPYGIEPHKPASLIFESGKVAEEIPGPLSNRLSQMAKHYHVWLSPGSIYEREGDAIYNTAPIYSPQGELVAKYRKLFPWRPIETTASGRDFCTFDIPKIGRFGLMICNDGWFPEVIRTLVWKGAEVIIHPTLTFTIDRSPDLIVIQAHAILNQCYMININAASTAGVGRSIIVDPNGRILQQAVSVEEILVEVIDLDLVRQVREFGTLGLDQHLKQLRDFEGEFPIYTQGIRNGKLFQTLGPIQMPKNFQDRFKPSKT
jgi:formamidase